MSLPGLRPDLHRVQLSLDAAPDRAVIIDKNGDAWQKSGYLGYWYRAFEGNGISTFELAQNTGPKPAFVYAPAFSPSRRKDETMSTATYEPLQLAPIGLREANAWVDLVHRHHEPVRGHKFSVSVLGEEGTLLGVGIAGRPVSKALQLSGHIEIVRVATDGTPNVPSMIYGALRGAAVRLGYPAWKVITYTLESEPGTSLLAAGFVFDGTTDGGSWDRPGRRRTDKAPTVPKKRWLGARRPASPVQEGTQP